MVLITHFFPEVPPWLDLMLPPVLSHLFFCRNNFVCCHYQWTALIASATISCTVFFLSVPFFLFLWWSSFTRKYCISISFVHPGHINYTGSLFPFLKRQLHTVKPLMYCSNTSKSTKPNANSIVWTSKPICRARTLKFAVAWL